MISRAVAEAGVCLLTSALLATALWRDAALPDETHNGAASVPASSSVGLLLLTLAGIVAEHQAGDRLGVLFRQRAAASSGLALGCLLLPWTFAGLVVRHRTALAAAGGQGSGPGQLAATSAALQSCLAASTAALVVLLLQSMQTGLQASQRSTAAAARSPRHHVSWVLAAALAAAVLQAAAAGAQRGPWHAAQVLASAAAACVGFRALLTWLPGTFTLGEALVASQSAALLLSTAAQLSCPSWVLPGAVGGVPAGPCQRFVVLLTAGSVLAAGLLLPLLVSLRQHPTRDKPGVSGAQGRKQQGRNGGTPVASGVSVLALAAVAVAAVAAAAAVPAALWALRFALASRRRLLLLCWWGADMAASLPAMAWLGSSDRVPGILVRKGYHLLAVSLFLPALLLEPQLLGVALAGAFMLLLGVEALRLSGIPAIAPTVHAFMTSFIDARDSGPILVTHFTLLLGMAAPIWLSNALQPDAGGALAGGAGEGGTHGLWLPAFAGVMILGFGDTAASAVGSVFGRLPIFRGSKKTVEGTAAAVAATLAAWGLLAVALSAASSGGVGLGIASWRQLAAATALSCLLEAVTMQLDNIFVPLHYFALLCLL